MGTIQHKAMIVTGYDFGRERKLSQTYTKAKKLFPKELISLKPKKVMNGYASFTIMPCGSKLGWELDQEHDKSIRELMNYIDNLRDEDGSNAVEYVYITFGELGLTTDTNVYYDCNEE